jgi:hypothetical protein
MADLPYEPTPRAREAERARVARRKLQADAPERARELAALGLPLRSIAAALGVHRATLCRWRTEAGTDGPERDLCDAIDRGRMEGETALIQRLLQAAQEGDTRAAQWLLCHSPDWRQDWSDAAAERRAVDAHAARFCDVLLACPDLTAETRHRLLLALAAAGAASLPTEDEDGQEGRRLLREWLAETEA